MMPLDQPQFEYSANPSRQGMSALQLLHIESEDVDAMNLRLIAEGQLPPGSVVEHVESLDEGIELLNQRLYDAVLLGVADTSHASQHSIKQLVGEVDDVPVIVLSTTEDTRAAVAVGRCGVSTLLNKQQLTAEHLCGALREALEHHHYEGELPNRRKDARYQLELPAVIYPLESNGKPGREIHATTVDVGENGIGVLIQQDFELVPDVCVLGVQCPDGVYRYATVEWRYRRLALPSLQLGGRFLRRADDPLHVSRLMPRLDPQKLQFRTSLASDALHEWVARGVLRPFAIDRVKVCPECESLPSFRDGCPKCGSAMTESQQLIHHFACAHIAPAQEYESSGLSCPKCGVQNLVLGADLEYLDGSLCCRECKWSDSELKLIGECLRCGSRFHADRASEKEVYEYHLDRLDPSALIDRA